MYSSVQIRSEPLEQMEPTVYLRRVTKQAYSQGSCDRRQIKNSGGWCEATFVKFD
jgi:hypothetical protein